MYNSRKNSNYLATIAAQERKQLDLDPAEEARARAQQAKKELQLMIDMLDTKIKRRLQINESQILFAYRNHLQRVTKQLTALKEMTQQNEKKFSADQLIIDLTKQCALFRQEAMRLHSQLEDSLLDADVYRRKAELTQREIKKVDGNLKEMIGRIKKLQAEKYGMSQQIKELNAYIQAMKEAKLNKEKLINDQNAGIDIQATNKDNEYKIKIPDDPNKSQSQPKKTNHPRLIRDLLNSSFDSYIDHTTPQDMHKSYSKKDLYSCSNYSGINIFTNQRILRKVPNKVINMKSMTGRTRIKTQSSVYKSNRNLMSSLEREREVHQVEREAFGENDYARKELRLCEELLTYIKIARNEHQDTNKANPHECTSLVQLLNDDELLSQWLQLIFPDLDLQFEAIEKGGHFKLKMKQNRKTLAHLSAQLMQKFKRRQVGESPNTPKQVVPNANRIILLQDQDEPQHRYAIKQSPRVQPISPSIKKMNEAFKKKNLTRQQRMTTYSHKKGFY